MKFEIEVESMPDGFRPVAYRPLEEGEWFLGANGEAVLSTCGHSAPWLILEKIDKGEEPKDINEVRGASLKKLEQDVSGLRESCLKLANRLVAAEEAQSLHMDGVAKRLEKVEQLTEIQSQNVGCLTTKVNGNMSRVLNLEDASIPCLQQSVEELAKRIQALEQSAKPEPTKPQPYGLWNLDGGNWHSKSPFESAGDVSRYAAKTLHSDWRNYWRVYPYPEDGGQPIELREPEKWGLWGGTGGSEPYWFGQEDEGVCLESEEDIQEVRSLLEFPERWTPYPYPEDGGKPVELREKWGLWGTNGKDALVPEPHWYGPDDPNYLADSKDAVLKIKEELISIGDWTPYPYPADGGMPMELRTVALDFHGKPLKQKQIDRPTVYYVRNKTTGNFLRRVDQKDRNTLFVTEDQALAEHMAQGTEGGPYEVYPVTLGE